MENDEPKTLEQRVAELEAAMHEMATIIAPASLRTLGTVAVLQACIRAAAEMLPPGSMTAKVILEFLDQAGRDMHGSFADPVTLQQFDEARQDLENRLGRDPNLLVKTEPAK